MHKILVPTDFSFLANCSVNFAVQFAKIYKAGIKLLHIVDPPASGTMNSTGEIIKNHLDDVFILKLVERTKKLLEGIVHKYSDEGVEIEYEVRFGEPADSIILDITKSNIDLVIMGSRGASRINRLILGSTTEDVIRKAQCPVITMKCNVDNIKNMQRILYVLNLEKDKPEMIHELVKLQKLLNAHVHILTVITPEKFRNSRLIQRQTTAFAEENRIEDYSISLYAEESEEAGILHFAEEINADLIALSTHHRSGIFNILSSNLPEELISHAHRPVWVYNAESSKVYKSTLHETATISLQKE
ncbi:universal stress protein [Cesiribacter sp. SM1]|uniref:universal stress protein n=1 Tax=Cesiribacter sp. SM1 TaxID=2861196 RepID=UPI001CD5805D|nr:universal stress protein [Cesiribacter sp. SM1]